MSVKEREVSQSPGWIVEIDRGCWLAPWSGDPGRTLVIGNAKIYQTERGAKIALGLARKHRKLPRGHVTMTSGLAKPKSA